MVALRCSKQFSDVISPGIEPGSREALYYESNRFKNSFPVPDFKYFSLFLAEILSGNSSE
jgi:hypothetical protein